MANHEAKVTQRPAEHSHHPFVQIGIADDHEFPTYQKDDGFYQELCDRVKEYFDETGEDPKDWRYGALRMIPVFALYALSYCLVQGLIPASWPVRVAAAVVFGLCQVLPLLHVMHDASHTAIGHSETGYKFWGQLTLDWMAGASMLSWHHQHTIGHHVYTNVYGADPDLPAGGEPRRFVERQRWASIYQWQWLYMPVLYGLLAMKVRVDDVLFVWLGGMNGPIRVNYYDSPLFRVFAVKGGWAAYRILIPLLVLGVPFKTWLALFIISELTSGYWLAWNFEVSHISEHTFFPTMHEAAKDGELPITWAKAQVLTGVEYGHQNTLTTFMCGALNYQIVHHLFPSVSQYHYPALAPIVMDVCEKHNVPFRVEPSFAAAFHAHLRHLYNMGRKGRAASL